MAGSRKKAAGSGKKRLHFTRGKLLPTPVQSARTASLRHHLALVALRRGEGDSDELIATLMRSLFIACFLLDAELSVVCSEDFLESERALKTCIERCANNEQWALPETACASIEAVLRIYDEQLMALPVHRLDEAGQRLGRILASGAFPEIKPRVVPDQPIPG